MVSAKEKKKIVICALGGCVLLPIMVFVGYKSFQNHGLWPFTSKSASADITQFFFEKNTGIFEKKAEKAMIIADDMLQNNKYSGYSKEHIKLLRDALSSYGVNVIYHKHTGLVFALISWLNNDKDLINTVRKMEIDNLLDKNAQRFVRVIKELACHIYVQKRGGEISLKEYNDALYEDPKIIVNANILNALGNDLFKKTQKEYEIVEKYVEVFRNKPEMELFISFEDYIYGDVYKILIKQVEKLLFENRGSHLQTTNNNLASDLPLQNNQYQESDVKKLNNEIVISEEYIRLTKENPKKIEKIKSRIKEIETELDLLEPGIAAIKVVQSINAEVKCLKPEDLNYLEKIKQQKQEKKRAIVLEKAYHNTIKGFYTKGVKKSQDTTTPTVDSDEGSGEGLYNEEEYEKETTTAINLLTLEMDNTDLKKHIEEYEKYIEGRKKRVEEYKNKLLKIE